MATDNLISLKEAAQISGYTPDYIGQLIRNGKIKGEKVYCNISWMTTAGEVLNYKNNKKDEQKYENLNTIFEKYSNRIASEFKFIKIFLSNIRTLLPIMVFFLVCMILAVFFILDLAFNNGFISSNCSHAESGTPALNQVTPSF